MLPLSEILTGIENDLLMSFLEIQKVKDLKIGKKNPFTSQIVSNYLNLTKFQESLSCQPID